MADYEQTLAQINQCFVYKLPPRTTAKGYRAAEWNASAPLWSGRLKVTSKGDKCFVTLLDATSGELFALCPVDDTAVEAVTDSSRYFVLRIENQGKHAFVGLGFAERNEAFDFNVALQDHKKYLRNKAEAAAAQTARAKEPEVDYTLKGPIKVSLGAKTVVSTGAKVVEEDDGDFTGLLAPPPKAKTQVQNNAAAPAAPQASSLNDLFGSLGGGTSNAKPATNTNWMSF